MVILFLKVLLASIVFPVLLWLLWRRYLKNYLMTLFPPEDEDKKIPYEK